MKTEDIKKAFFEVILDLNEKKGGKIFINDLEAEVINYACLFCILNPQMDVDKVADFFTKIAVESFPEYDESYALVGRSSIKQNLKWHGMKDFLIKYYKNNHNININLP